MKYLYFDNMTDVASANVSAFRKCYPNLTDEIYAGMKTKVHCKAKPGSNGDAEIHVCDDHIQHFTQAERDRMKDIPTIEVT